MQSLCGILGTAQNRPQLANYPKVSSAIQQYIHLALQHPDQYPVNQALQLLQGQLEQIIAQAR